MEIDKFDVVVFTLVGLILACCYVSYEAYTNVISVRTELISRIDKLETTMVSIHGSLIDCNCTSKLGYTYTDP